MKLKEFLEIAKDFDPEADMWLPATNPQGIKTYGLCDHVFEEDFMHIVDDVMNNPGDIDDRLIAGKGDSREKVIVFCSKFE